ncbi:MAG: hypothetical protein IPM56_01755 [Ignavibacteriales bacterium]|nr:MAG: hypothetical protein IPM56_01755 [Ignavibacteriales bacterium]
MKTFKTFILVIPLLILLPDLNIAQDIKIHELIGKKKSELVKKYGNPVHQDNSNPNIICMFFKSKSASIIFVSDKDGVFQAEATASYDSESSARKQIDNFISSSMEKEYSVDTVTTSDFRLHKHGVKVELQIAENKLSKQYDIKVKANRTEE